MTARSKALPLNGAFRFTEWQLYQFHCDSWLDWFKAKGVPAAIIQYDAKKSYSYAVFRVGEENKNEEAAAPDEHFIPEEMSVVDSVNGFELKFDTL